VLCSKGVEQGSLKLMTEVLAEALPGAPIAVLSGPSFAGEVARGLPAAVTLACEDEALGGPSPRPSPPRPSGPTRPPT
jgi:glycerol-3-phosphate dehydrogenase (NAD(P)+)